MSRIVSAVCFFSVLCASAHAQTYAPLATESVECVSKNEVVVETGFSALKTPFIMFRYPDGELYAVTLGVHIGAAENVEIQIEGSPCLHASPDNGDSENETGDFLIRAKWAFLQKENFGAGARFGVKLPNTSDESGLGTDETDFFAEALFERAFGNNWLVLTNAGIAILGDPTKHREQNDVATWGVALRKEFRKWSLMGEVSGKSGKGSSPVENIARCGFQTNAKQWGFYGAVLAGLNSDAPDFGVAGGVIFRHSFSKKSER